MLHILGWTGWLAAIRPDTTTHTELTRMLHDDTVLSNSSTEKSTKHQQYNVIIPTNFISVQPPCRTRSLSLVTLAWPPTSSLLRITDRSFRYASPCLWDQLPTSLHQPHSSLSIPDLPFPAPTISPFVDSPLSPSITPSVFHSWLKTFHKSFPPQTLTLFQPQD